MRSCRCWCCLRYCYHYWLHQVPETLQSHCSSAVLLLSAANTSTIWWTAEMSSCSLLRTVTAAATLLTLLLLLALLSLLQLLYKVTLRTLLLLLPSRQRIFEETFFWSPDLYRAPITTLLPYHLTNSYSSFVNTTCLRVSFPWIFPVHLKTSARIQVGFLGYFPFIWRFPQESNWVFFGISRPLEDFRKNPTGKRYVNCLFLCCT